MNRHSRFTSLAALFLTAIALLSAWSAPTASADLIEEQLPASAAELAVIETTVKYIYCPGDRYISVAHPTYSAHCSTKTGGTIVQMQRFDSENLAKQGLALQGAGAVKYSTFNGYPAKSWQVTQKGVTTRGHAWFAGQWLITATATDNAPKLTNPSPLSYSVSLYKAASEHNLFQ